MNINLSQAFKINLSYLTKVMLFSLPAIIIMATINADNVNFSDVSILFLEIVGLIVLLPVRILAFRKTIFQEQYKQFFEQIIKNNSKQYKFFFAWLLMAEVPVFALHNICDTIYPHLIKTEFYLLVHFCYSAIASAIVLRYLINNKPKFI